MVDKERERALVAAARRGDSHSFGLLYETIYQDLYKTALYILQNPEDAENVVSDTALDAYAGLTKLRSDDAFRGWIFRILNNKCNRLLRGYVKRREMEMSASIDDMAETLQTGESVESDVENRSMVQQAFKVLSEEERRIVTLTVYGEYDSNEVAGIMNLNRNTVRSKYSRALEKMRRALSPAQ
ncbi:MAG: sigma-70 family RNA polymerase sigma factor [Eubacterium sp.]|nr:sigma-70 family RNA polymerase sigma factor [Eubacterium sp.]